MANNADLPNKTDNDESRALGAALDEFRTKNRVPAVVGAVVGKNRLAACVAVGSRRRDNPADSVTIDDLWHIGSCGKSITAVLWARLVEAGLTEWNVPVRSLFPDLVDINQQWGGPTIDDVLRCTAGITPNPSKTQMTRLWACSLPEVDQRTEAARSILAEPPHKPGRFSYSNLGYALAGAAIDRVTGTTFEQALRTHVLTPLGIESLDFGPPPLVLGHRPRVHLGPIVAGRGHAANPDDPTSDNPALLNPAGRMHLSISDWATFQQVFVNEGQPLLSRHSLYHLLEVPKSRGQSMGMGWVSGHGAGASYGMQGSNTMWSATAIINADLTRTALVITNDGRSKVLANSAKLAADLLTLGPARG